MLRRFGAGAAAAVLLVASPFCQAADDLVAARPHPALGDRLALYGQFVGRWRAVWVHPIRNDVTLMTAHRVGTEIVQDVDGETGAPSRRVFYDIAPDRFRWRGEEQTSTGEWTLLQEMTVVRLP